MYSECLVATPSEMEIVLHETDLRAKPTAYDQILSKAKDSWSFLQSIAEDLIEEGDITSKEVATTLELYSYDFITSRYSVEGSIPIFGVIDNNSEFYMLLEDNGSTGNQFLNRLPRIELSLGLKNEVYNRLNFTSAPYSQNGSDVLIYNKKQIFMAELKLWRK
jgi:hypothetical protein